MRVTYGRASWRSGFLATGALTLCLFAGSCKRSEQESSAAGQPPVVRLQPKSAELVTLPAGILPIDGPELLALIRKPDRKGTLINVWASWCGSCRVEMPMLLKLRQHYRPLGIELLLVSVDAPQDAAKAKAFLDSQPDAPEPTLLVKGSLGHFKQNMSPQWRGSLPATFLFDNEGKLRYYWGAQVYEEELRPILDGFLAGEPIDGAANFSIRRGSDAP